MDSSDPVGPAIPLFGLDFYKSLYNILKNDGLMVCQSESPIFHFETMKQTYKRLCSLFPITRPYTTVVPTYPGGMWSFTLASKKYGDTNPSQFDKENKKTKYVNSEILKQCFALPEFVRSRLGFGLTVNHILVAVNLAESPQLLPRRLSDQARN